MKNYLFALGLTLFVLNATAQTQNHRFGIASGGTIQHYRGDLGNSFFKFKSCCFGAETITFGYYLDKTFDLNVSTTIGDFGYWQPPSTANQVVPRSKRCPGCNRSGMGELRSRMVSGSVTLKYKLNNGIVFREGSRLSPYLYLGIGTSHLADRMKRKCVSVGNHFSVNTGAGVKYDLTSRFSVGYNLGVACFTNDKVYATVGDTHMNMQGEKDMLMQNTLFIGMNF